MRLVRPYSDVIMALSYREMCFLISSIACVCYHAETPLTLDAQEKFIKARLDAGHESVIEHVGFTARFRVNRGISHELVRHRIGVALTQESQRYCCYNKDKFNKEITYIIPPIFQNELPEVEYSGISRLELTDGGWELVTSEDRRIRVSEDCAHWVRSLLMAESRYMALVDGGTAPEYARDVLPNATATTLYLTANMREWRHIFNLRYLGKTGRPHPQMVEVMSQLFMQAHSNFPIFFADMYQPPVVQG